MNQSEQCNGYTTLDEFIDSLLPDDIAYNNQLPTPHVSKNKSNTSGKIIANTTADIVRSSELPSELNIVEKTREDSPKPAEKQRPTQLDVPVVLQTMSLDGTIQPKTNFNTNSSVLYSPPLSPECVALNVPLKSEESQQTMILPTSGHVSPMTGEHPILHPISPQGKPTFIGEKSFEKTYVYDPKPLTRKTRRALVPDEQKNQKYWIKRMRNNVAARKSREDRRRKELEVLNTMNALQEENQKMKLFINDIVKANEQLVAEMVRMKHQMALNNGASNQQRSISLS